MGANILVVDDEKDICEPLAINLRKVGHRVETAYDGEKALELLKKQIFDLMLLDHRLPRKDGMQVLREAMEIDPDLLVIMITAHGTIESAVQAMKAGAYDYLMKPIEIEELRMVVKKSLETLTLKRQASLQMLESERRKDDPFIGNHPKIMEVINHIKLVAATPRTSVLIKGETGTGKELVAKAIHNWSDRSDKPLISINCTALTENLAESELFGHEKGAFTDAKTLKKGLFELSHTGTIFLDEISSMSMFLQPKLLRVLETHSVRRVGGTNDIEIDVRVIAATNQDIQECIRKGIFREDLFYRLDVMEIVVPPLRERTSDIIILAKYFISRNNSDFNKNIQDISPEAMDILTHYSWPGNIRELRNVLERACILCRGEIIEANHLPGELSMRSPASFTTTAEKTAVDYTPTAPPPLPKVMPEEQSLQEMEKQHILNILEKYNGNKSKTARILNISRSTLREKLKQYEIG
ncbi:sigma-54-dependent Fis family transcriptional regulator [candidate division KSB1 bacterium]|nr:sigma-54-dependent Fis family transcriptional regulator [candidate division KSB1 bacterium]